MIIHRMTAAFGRLDRQTLAPGPGLTVITAPNEGGKSTWCAFLRAMLYGIPTNQRDRGTFIADKNRYLPWSGAPLSGEMQLKWRGQDITLRRFPRKNSPFGGLEAVYTASGDPVPGLTADTLGETLIGAGREMYERSAFLGQGAAAVTASDELERRVAALVSSGSEEASYSQVERTLREWRNRRRHNRTGLLPRLEEELSQVETALERQEEALLAIQAARAQIARLEPQRAALERELESHRSRDLLQARQQYTAAREELNAASGEVARLRQQRDAMGRAPDRESLDLLRDKLGELKALEREAAEGREALRRLRQEAELAQAEVQDSGFAQLTVDQAEEQAHQDHQQADTLRSARRRRGIFALLWALLGLAAGGALAAAGYFLHRFIPFAAGGAALFLVCTILSVVLCRRRQRALDREAGALLAKYGAKEPGDIDRRLEAYRAAEVRAEVAWGAFHREEELQQERQERVTDLTARLRTAVGTFSPHTQDRLMMELEVARAAALLTDLEEANERMAAARRALAGTRAPGGSAAAPGETVVPRYPLAETRVRLEQAEEALRAARRELDQAQGRLSTLGGREELEARRQTLEEAIAGRTREYDALTAALEALEGANLQLRQRFSPGLNARAGEYLARLTGGAHQGVTLSRAFEAMVTSPGDPQPRRALLLSQGTLEQLYLAVRLAICDLTLGGDEPAPLVLDDALANFDDRRAVLALELLRELGKKRQILLFTCHTREARWARTAGVPVAELGKV